MLHSRPMKQIKTYNNISAKGLSKFPQADYQVGPDIDKAEAIICRSAKLHELDFNPELLAIGRAGAGTNNVPVARATEAGLVVFNTPGANANAVKELVMTGMLLASRNICAAWQYAQSIEGDDEQLHKEMEANKKHFKGMELPGRTLGIIGLGHIGVKVANAAIALGMNVVGFDPAMTIRNAWELSPEVKQADSVEEVCKHADFLTVHVPLIDATKNLINAARIKLLPKGAVLLNFARNGIIDNDALLSALNNDQVAAYVSDFPLNLFKNNDKVITLPHIGASTIEAEENCAMMIADTLMDFLTTGNIRHSVNFPAIKLPVNEDCVRLTVINQNIPNMVAQISAVLAENNVNIADMINKSRGDIAYNIIDISGEINESTINKLNAIDGVIRTRLIR